MALRNDKGSVAGGAMLAERLASVLARERCPGFEAGEGHGLGELATLVVGTTLAPGAAADGGILEKVEAALDELPGLDAGDEDDGEANGESPLPGDAHMLEELGVEVGNVDDGEDGETADDDGPEEEAVGVNILEDGELAIVIGVEVEHGSSETLELPGRDENQPGKFSKGSSTSLEDGAARVRVALVALEAQVSAVGAIDDDAESAHGADTHDDTIDKHVHNDLVGKDTALLVLRGLAHDVGGSSFTAETKGRE